MIVINEVSMPEHYKESFWLAHMSRWPSWTLVAKEDGKIVGYVMSRPDNMRVGRYSTMRVGLIISLAVDPAYRGRGIGEELMLEIGRAMRLEGVGMLGLQVRISNPAVKFYEKVGLAKSLTILKYYDDGEDAYLMTLVL